MGVFDDMESDDLNGYEAAKAKKLDPAMADTRKAAHAVHGGEVEGLRECGGCHGTGRWKGRGTCMACKGTGKVTARRAAAQKGKVTAANNLATKRTTYISTNMELYTFLKDAATWSDFGRSMFEAIDQYGSLTERQQVAAEGMMAKAKANKAAKEAAKTAEQDARTVAVDLQVIQDMFATAFSRGKKRPKYRAEGIVLSRAPDTGANKGAIYVKSAETDEYLGKVVGSKFLCTREATPAHKAALDAVAANPLEAAIKYGQTTGNCACCGRELTNKLSVELGIGPICRGDWGL